MPRNVQTDRSAGHRTEMSALRSYTRAALSPNCGFIAIRPDVRTGSPGIFRVTEQIIRISILHPVHAVSATCSPRDRCAFRLDVTYRGIIVIAPDRAVRETIPKGFLMPESIFLKNQSPRRVSALFDAIKVARSNSKWLKAR